MNGNENWLDAQYSVLGCALLWPELVPKVLMATSEADYTGPCQNVFRAIKQVDGAAEPVDVVTVNAALNGRYGDFLRQLMDVVPTSAYIDKYISILREQSRANAIRALAQQVVLAESTAEMGKLLEQASSLMVDRPNLRITSMKDGLDGFYRRQSEKPNYLTWPIPELNKRVFARPGSFVVLGGDPSTGKSAWALQCATHFAQRCKVGFFSLETSGDILMDRKLAALPELTMTEIETHAVSAEGWAAVAQATTTILNTDLHLIDAAGLPVSDIRAITTACKYKVIFVDYLQLIPPASGNNRAEQVAGISMALHTMAQRLGVTVIALSQLKRTDESASPSMRDLRESGQIEQDADVVMILKLEDESNPDGPRGLYIAKNKQGKRFKMVLDFDGQHQTFSKAMSLDQMAKLSDKSQRRPREKPTATEQGQMTMLPDDTPVPFREDWYGSKQT